MCGETESEVDSSTSPANGGRRLQQETEVLTLEATFTNSGD